MKFRLLILIVPFSAGVQSEPVPELGELVVKAMLPQLTQRIDSETVRDFGRRDLAEALTILPGVSLQRTGNRAETMVTVRGFDLKQVPVLIDGIPVYVPYDGFVDLGRFTVPGSGEFEVAKGISSVLAGPNALGGLINIVSRRPEERLEGSLFGGGFTGGGSEAGLNIGGREEKFYWQFDLTYLEADAFRLSDDFRPVPREDGGRRENSNRKDFRASGRVAWTPTVDDEYVLGFWSQRGEKGNPPYTGSDPTVRARFWQWPKWDKDTFYILTRTALSPDTTLGTNLHYDRFENTLKAYDNASYNSQARPSSFTSDYDDWTAGGLVSLENRSLENIRLATAVHYKRDHHEQQDAGFPTYTFEDDTASLGIEAERYFSSGSIVAGVSRDWRDVREAVDTNTGADLGGDRTNSWNPQLVYKHTFSDSMEGHIGFAQKSRFATIKDRYSFRLGQAIPNPDLQPETAEHIDIGVSGKTSGGKHEWSAGAFFSRVDNAIQRVDNVAFTPGGAGLFQLQNVGEVEHKGVEFAGGTRWNESIETGLRFAYIHVENRSDPSIRIFGTPEHELLLFAKLKMHERFRLIPSFTWADSRVVTSLGKEVGVYQTLDLKAEVLLPMETTLGLGVNNLLDRNQQLDEGFPEPGRSFFVNLRHEF